MQKSIWFFSPPPFHLLCQHLLQNHSTEQTRRCWGISAVPSLVLLTITWSQLGITQQQSTAVHLWDETAGTEGLTSTPQTFHSYFSPALICSHKSNAHQRMKHILPSFYPQKKPTLCLRRVFLQKGLEVRRPAVWFPSKFTPVGSLRFQITRVLVLCVILETRNHS